MADVGRDVTLLSSLTLSKTKDNGSQSLENANGNFPAPQDFHNLDADFGTVGVPPAVQQHDELRVVAAVRRGQRWASPLRVDALIGGWQLAGINRINAGEPVTLTYTPGATFVVSGIAQDFRGANNYRANVTLRSRCAGRSRRRSRTGSTRTASSVPTDPSQPFGNAGRNTVRGPNFWQMDHGARRSGSRSAGRRSSSSGSRRSIC